MAFIDKSIEVGADVREVYAFWTAFEDYPTFMEVIDRVTMVPDDRLHWMAVVDVGDDAEVADVAQGCRHVSLPSTRARDVSIALRRLVMQTAVSRSWDRGPKREADGSHQFHSVARRRRRPNRPSPPSQGCAQRSRPAAARGQATLPLAAPSMASLNACRSDSARLSISSSLSEPHMAGSYVS